MQKPIMPLVSVLICSYNAAEFIRSTVASVLNQSYRNLELLILDNASKDKTTEIIREITKKDIRVKLFASETNLGSYPGLNYLLERAKGKYIAINDHDDIWYPEKLERQIAFLETHKEYVGCGTAIENWYEKYDKAVVRRHRNKDSVAWHTSLVFRNTGYRYDTSIPLANDFFYMKNILCGGKRKIANISDVLVKRRIFETAGNLSGKWMRGVKPGHILKLRIGWIDKLALLNRLFMPSSLVEWLWVHLG